MCQGCTVVRQRSEVDGDIDGAIGFGGRIKYFVAVLVPGFALRAIGNNLYSLVKGQYYILICLLPEI